MATLTKSQQAELDKLREERDCARALSWPNFPEPKPMAGVESGEKMIGGWAFNAYSLGSVGGGLGSAVYQEWQNACYSYHNAEGRNGSQRRGPLYATKRDAALALYCELARTYGRSMAMVLKLAESEDAH